MKIKITALSAILLVSSLAGYARGGEADRIPVTTSTQRITEVALSLAVNASLTEIFKHSVHETRPDGDGRNSFPSRHTSWAFTASTVLGSEFYRTAPWVPLAAHAAATGIGLQRVVVGRHYGGDVAAGAALGILSTEAAYALTRVFFRRSAPVATGSSAFTKALYISSDALFATNSRSCSGFAGTVGGIFPISDHWGISIALTAASANMRHKGRASAAYGWTSAGAVYSLPLPRAWEMQASVAVGGGARRLCRLETGYKAIFVARPDVHFIWHLTPRFAAGFRAGYLSAGDLSAMTAGVTSNLVF